MLYRKTNCAWSPAAPTVQVTHRQHSTGTYTHHRRTTPKESTKPKINPLPSPTANVPTTNTSVTFYHRVDLFLKLSHISLLIASSFLVNSTLSPTSSVLRLVVLVPHLRESGQSCGVDERVALPPEVRRVRSPISKILAGDGGLHNIQAPFGRERTWATFLQKDGARKEEVAENGSL